MRTRERSITAVQDSAPALSVATGPAEVKRVHLSDPDSSQLKGRGFAMLRLLPDTFLALAVAAGDLQAQLKHCSKQSLQGKLVRFRYCPHKEQLKHHPGDSVLHDLPILQHVTAEVSLPHARLHMH